LPNALDQFYTKPEVASLCFDTIKHREYDLWLEPSAGTGRFYNLLPVDKRKGIDLEPRHDEVEKQDFFDFTIEQGNNIAIGNPPFGYRAQGAIAFFNHAAKFCNTIAFIVPRSFRKAYIINQLHSNFHVSKEIILEIGIFDGGAHKIRTVWQVWDKQEYKRDKIVLPSKHVDFEIVSQGLNFDVNEADIAIRRTGYKAVGEVVFPEEALPITQYVFIKIINEKAIELFEDLNLECAFDTALSPTVTQGEIIQAYIDRKGS
jgi:hypothetical protein